MSLAGKTALVTGGGTGAGAVIALALASEGAQVVICGRRSGPLETVAAKAPGIRAVTCDVTDETAVAAMMDQAQPDIVIANAGASETAPFDRTSLDAFNRMISVNLTGTFLTLREGARVMKGREGRLIAIASTAALKGYAYVSAYAAAKHGVLGLVRSAALEYARKGLTVNAICPGFLDTEMTERSVANIVEKTGRTEQEARATLEATNPMHRLVPPGEVAQTVLWLCSPAASMVTGQAISVSGGET